MSALNYMREPSKGGPEFTKQNVRPVNRGAFTLKALEPNFRFLALSLPVPFQRSEAA